MNRELLKKHEFVIKCAVDYYVKNVPTGISDEKYDELEKAALADGIDVRKIAMSKIRGNRVRNRYITGVPKTYTDGSMYQAIMEFYNSDECPKDAYIEPKYDGSSIAVYFNDGVPYQVVTCGGSNKTSDEGGVDRTAKFLRFIPPVPPYVKAIQCEVLTDARTNDRPRQYANGLVTSEGKYTEEEIAERLRIRCFRYYSDEPYEFMDTMIKINEIPFTVNDQNFRVGRIMSVSQFLELMPQEVVDSQKSVEYDGSTFLIDGYVFYRSNGEVIKAIKFKNAGGQEAVEVDHIRWNDLSANKDGFSANVILKTPVEIRGSNVYKPSSNGVNNLLKNNISSGAMVSVTLRGSTIPCVDKVFSPGNGDFNWPVCKCGTQLGPNDVYGNNLKCPNLMCSCRYERMTNYLLGGWFNFDDIRTYNGLFIIDRFDFAKKIKDAEGFSNEFHNIIRNDLGYLRLQELIMSLGLSSLQAKNLDLVIRPAYNALLNNYDQYEHS